MGRGVVRQQGPQFQRAVRPASSFGSPPRLDPGPFVDRQHPRIYGFKKGGEGSEEERERQLRLQQHREERERRARELQASKPVKRFVLCVLCVTLCPFFSPDMCLHPPQLFQERGAGGTGGYHTSTACAASTAGVGGGGCVSADGGLSGALHEETQDPQEATAEGGYRSHPHEYVM